MTSLRTGITSQPFRGPSCIGQRRAFTLIELVVVVLVIAVLAGILIPAVSLVRASAKTSLCANNLRQIGIAMMTYGNDNELQLPAGWNTGSTFVSWDDLLAGYDGRDLPQTGPNYSINAEFLKCPDGSAKQRKIFSMYGCPNDAGFVRGPWVGGMNSLEYWPRTYAFAGIAEGDGGLSSTITRQTGVFSGGDNNGPSLDWSARLGTISSTSTQILLCEQLYPLSVMGRQRGSTCKGPQYQNADTSYRTFYGIDPLPLHQGKWNYLLVDGHTELRTGESTMDPSMGLVILPGAMWRR